MRLAKIKFLLGLLLFTPFALQKTGQAAPKLPVHFGINLSGAEFGEGALPGRFDTDYTYPTAAGLDYYRSRGRRVVRLPFKWERIQRGFNSELDNDELARLKTVVSAAARREMQVLLDVHNFGRYRLKGQDEIIGDKVPVAAFADLWAKLAAEFRGNPGVFGYGLMNEPHDMGDEVRWPQAAQAAIDAIRKIDSKTAIFVPGDNWSGAREWRKGPNEKLASLVRDPADNLVFEAHCYFDRDLSGSYKKSYKEEGGTPDVGIDHARPFVEWCRAKGVRGFVGEFGVPDNDPRWLVTMDRFLHYLQSNGMGACYWAGGPWWGKYPLSIEPADARENLDKPAPDRPQMLILQKFPG